MCSTSRKSTFQGSFMRRRRGLLVTDLDGTLLGADRRLRACDRAALTALGQDGFYRAIATGRSLHSFGLVAGERFPVDYVVFSSGAGIYDVRHRCLLRAYVLTGSQAKAAAQVLDGLDLDFMVHRPIPDNHYFQYRRSGQRNPDFEGRMERYRAFASPLSWDPGPSAQLLAVVPIDRSEPSSEHVAQLLPNLTVIRTTSPLDHRSTWIEVFPSQVSKSQAAEWLATRHGIPRGQVCAIGNDYNDSDLLAWAGDSYVVANAAPELRARYAVVGAGGHCGVAEAVRRWRAV